MYIRLNLSLHGIQQKVSHGTVLVEVAFIN